MIHIDSYAIVHSFSEEVTPQAHEGIGWIKWPLSLAPSSQASGEESKKWFASSVCECVNTQKICFLSRVQSSSYKTFKSQSAKGFKDANIDIGLGEFTEGKTVSLCILSLLKENT